MRSKPVLGFFLAVVIMGAAPSLSAQESSGRETRRGPAVQELRALSCHRHGGS